MTRRALLTAGLAVLIGSTRKLFAHHSTAMYDMANPVTVKGTVKRFEWTNPHAFIFLDVKDEKGWFGRVGDRAHEPQPPALVWVDAHDGQTGRHRSAARAARQERRPVDDQRRDRTARRSQDSLVSRRTHASASASHRSHPRDSRFAGHCRGHSRRAAATAAAGASRRRRRRGRRIRRPASSPPASWRSRRSRSTIKPGESVTLTWAVENPRTTTIEPTVGRAVPRGEMKVTPAATTTYTLTVTGVNGTLTRTVTVTVAGTTPVAASAESIPLHRSPAPRTR